MVHRSEVRSSEKQCIVDGNESCVLKTRSWFGAEKTKIGDRSCGGHSYSRLSLLWKMPDRRESRLGMKKAKPGTFGDSGAKGEGYPQDHRTMHRDEGKIPPTQV